MTNLEKTLASALLIAAVLAPSTGCKAVRNGPKAKEGKQLLTKVRDGATPILNKVARIGVESKAGNKLPSEFGEMGMSGLHRGAPQILQSWQSGQPRQTRSGAGFVRDEIVDRFIAVAEDEASYVNMYRHLPSDAQLRSLNPGVSTIASTTSESYGATGEKNFLAYLDKSPSEYIIIIVHNKKGQVFFPNGDKMRLETMARLISERNKKGIFLSCEAKEHLHTTGLPATTIKITFDEAVTISEEIVEKLRGNSVRMGYMWNNSTSTSKGLQLLGGNYSPQTTISRGDDRVLNQIEEIIKSGERNAMVKRRVLLIKKGGAIGAVGGAVSVPVYYYDIKLKANNKTQKASPTIILPALGNSATGKLPPAWLRNLESLRR